LAKCAVFLGKFYFPEQEAAMLTYNMDVEPRSSWLRTTPGTLALAQPYYCTEAGRFYGRARFATARTDKESHILFFTLRGAGLIEQNGAQLVLPQGQALLMDCRTPQSYCTAPGQSCWHHDWLHIDGTGVQALHSLLCPGKLCPVELPAALQKEFETVFAALPNADTASVLTVSLAIHKLLCGMAQALLETDRLAAASNRALIDKAVEHIQSHYQDPLALEDLLELAPVSKSYFLRLFRQYMGTTPYNFLLCTRMTRAKELLVLTDLSIGDIARHVGFKDESNFSTRFASMTGQSPRQYRKSAMTPR